MVVNDDGIKAKGIRTLVEHLSEEANVFVVAPNSQKSAAGHGITISKPVFVKECHFPKAYMAFEVHGTPADCVKVGLRILEEKGVEIDMVYSGINHGANLGTDTLYSGTVSAALEGAMCGKPSVAISLGSHEATDFVFSGEIALKVLRATTGKLAARTALNVNIPDIPRDEIRGIKYTRLGIREYEGLYKTRRLERKSFEAVYSGIPIKYDSDNNQIDVIAAQNNYITISPLQYDLTNHYLIDEIGSWGIEE